MTENNDLEIYFYVEDSLIHGKGLFARMPIEQGTYLGTYDGPETEENGMHVLWCEVDDDHWIGRDGQNMLRYINHSTSPCAEFDGFELFATMDIQEHQEITIDYGEEP